METRVVKINTELEFHLVAKDVPMHCCKTSNQNWNCPPKLNIKFKWVNNTKAGKIYISPETHMNSTGAIYLNGHWRQKNNT